MDARLRPESDYSMGVNLSTAFLCRRPRERLFVHMVKMIGRTASDILRG